MASVWPSPEGCGGSSPKEKVSFLRLGSLEGFAICVDKALFTGVSPYLASLKVTGDHCLSVHVSSGHLIN